MTERSNSSWSKIYHILCQTWWRQCYWHGHVWLPMWLLTVQLINEPERTVETTQGFLEETKRNNFQWPSWSPDVRPRACFSITSITSELFHFKLTVVVHRSKITIYGTVSLHSGRETNLGCIGEYYNITKHVHHVDMTILKQSSFY